MLDYFIALAIVFSGILVGYVVSYFSKEELKPGKNYFIFFKAVLLNLIFMTFLFEKGFALFLIFPIVFVLFTVTYICFKLRKNQTLYEELFFSIILAVIYGVGFSKYLAFLMFLYFISSTALDYEKGILKIFRQKILFLVLAIILKIQYVLLLFQ